MQRSTFEMAQFNGDSLRHRKAGAAAQQLRKLLAREKILVCPGVYDGFTARIALEAGFDALYMTGAGTSMSRLGMADLGLATMNDMSDNAGMLAGLDRTIPVIADADTGYGGPLMVRRTVERYMNSGVAALHIEDQVQTKRCGHLGSKELVGEEIFISRIRAAVLAREQAIMGGDILVIARTDALQSLGYDGAVGRLRKAVEAGADAVFLEAPTSIEQMRAVCRDLAPTPVLLNMVIGSTTPNVTADEAQRLGFKMIIFATFAMGSVYEAVSATARELKETGTVRVTESMKAGPKRMFEVCGLQELVAFDRAAGGASFQQGI